MTNTCITKGDQATPEGNKDKIDSVYSIMAKLGLRLPRGGQLFIGTQATTEIRAGNQWEVQAGAGEEL